MLDPGLRETGPAAGGLRSSGVVDRSPREDFPSSASECRCQVGRRALIGHRAWRRGRDRAIVVGRQRADPVGRTHSPPQRSSRVLGQLPVRLYPPPRCLSPGIGCTDPPATVTSNRGWVSSLSHLSRVGEGTVEPPSSPDTLDVPRFRGVAILESRVLSCEGE